MFVCPSVRSVDFNMLRSGGNLHPTPLPTVLIAPKAPVFDATYLSFLRLRRYYRVLPLCNFCAEGATIGRYLSVHFAPKALLSDVIILSFLRRRRHYLTLPICHFCAEGATIGRYLFVIFAPKAPLSDVTYRSILRRRR